jgi:hypothetical protein
MKRLAILFLTLFSHVILLAQPVAAQQPEFSFDKSEWEAHLMYIASDEMAGRRTASEGSLLAAKYLAEQFKAYGVEPAPGTDDYFQKIPFNYIQPPTEAKLTLGDSEYQLNEDILILAGGAAKISAKAVFAGHGWLDESEGIDDYKGLDVEGKIVFVLPGNPVEKGPLAMFRAMSVKRKLAAERGAVALFELYRMNFPWHFFKSYFGGDRLSIADDPEGKTNLVYGWLKEGTPNPLPELEQGKTIEATLLSAGVNSQAKYSPNVVGIIEGSDNNLKEEYVLLSAHYDHVGTGKDGGAPFTSQDSIFNGARDNGIGTVALLAAAKALTAKPPGRSVILLACTGEELGMLGSNYYVENPLIPLEKTIFNLNNDGAGYNSTEHISVIGWDKTDANTQVEEATKTFGLQIVKDPAPEQNLYERSDNISFANAGIPAINFSPGLTEMDEAIFKYYHQAADNPNSIDYDYLLRFCKAFANTARLIADRKDAPKWSGDDK